MRSVISVLMASFTVLLAPLSWATDIVGPATHALGLKLGVSSVSEVVWAFGPPRVTHLQGEETESGATSPDDDLVMRYSLPLVFGSRTHVAEVAIVFDHTSCRVDVIHITAPEPEPWKLLAIPAGEIEEAFGPASRKYRVRAIEYPIDKLGEEQESFCGDPGGYLEIWSYPAQGLEIRLTGPGPDLHLGSIRYATDLVGRDLEFKPCKVFEKYEKEKTEAKP